MNTETLARWQALRAECYELAAAYRDSGRFARAEIEQIRAAHLHQSIAKIQWGTQ